MYYVYVLKSKKDKGLYIGYTEDMEGRFNEHNKGLCISTKNRRPFNLAYYEAYSSKSDACIRDFRLKKFKNSYKELLKRIKKWWGVQFADALISKRYELQLMSLILFAP